MAEWHTWARDPAYCREIVYVADTYRRTGGKQRFKMHYTRKQCGRKPVWKGWCWQHARRHGLPDSIVSLREEEGNEPTFESR